MTEANPLPPMFQALIPPRPGPQDPPNLQRLLLSRILEREGLDKDGDPDWQTLLIAGRNAIGPRRLPRRHRRDRLLRCGAPDHPGTAGGFAVVGPRLLRSTRFCCKVCSGRLLG